MPKFQNKNCSYFINKTDAIWKQFHAAHEIGSKKGIIDLSIWLSTADRHSIDGSTTFASLIRASSLYVPIKMVFTQLKAPENKYNFQKMTSALILCKQVKENIIFIDTVIHVYNCHKF